MAAVITWHELITDDVDAAVRFYTELLGAEVETADMGDFQYHMVKKDGRTHAGFVKKEQAGTPSHWYPYVQVDDVDASVEKAKGLGAQVYMGPADVSDTLRFAVLGDPQRATFGVMAWDEDPPTGLFAWDELYALDVEAAVAFYGELFGWTTSSSHLDWYRLIDAGEQHIGGLMKSPDEMPVAAWGTHFATDDVQASVARAQEQGAEVKLPPTTDEQVGTYSMLADPQGALFGLYKATVVQPA
jgi:predicted enzyme related to lactoylglutathione lyase